MTDDTVERPILESTTDWDGGFSWMAVPDEDARRASHALDAADGVWLVDPVDAAGLDDRIAGLGDVVGVAVLHDRHRRDAAAVARRHGVPVYVPKWMPDVAGDLDGPTTALGDAVPGTNYAVRELVDEPDWQEAFLVDEATGTVLVPETVGTLSWFEGGDHLGVHPSLPTSPGPLADLEPERLLVGHGESVYRDATAKLRTALDGFEQS